MTDPDVGKMYIESGTARHTQRGQPILTVEQILAGETFKTPGARGRGDRQYDWIGKAS